MRKFFVFAFLISCSKKDQEEPTGVPALGAGSHTLSKVTVSQIGTDADGLNIPRDLDFSPAVENELWVVNRSDDSTTIYSDAGTASQTSRHVVDPYAPHFMEEVSSIAFGAAMHSGSDLPNFSTCQESTNTFNGLQEGDEFMGPTLWSSDPAIYGETNPAAVDYLSNLFGMYVDLGSHLDMLHETPLCTGIAWEEDNIYWVVNGKEGAINRIDFQDDHGPGFDDHDDGIIGRYVAGELSRVPDVPSHLEFDQNSAFLYIADTGNNAIKVLDTSSGTRGNSLPGTEPMVDHYEVDDASIWTLIDGAVQGMEQPSGLALVENTLLVTDHGTGIISAFNLDGELIDWVDTGAGSGALMGIVARSLDDIWFVDAKVNMVIRFES